MIQKYPLAVDVIIRYLDAMDYANLAEISRYVFYDIVDGIRLHTLLQEMVRAHLIAVKSGRYCANSAFDYQTPTGDKK